MLRATQFTSKNSKLEVANKVAAEIMNVNAGISELLPALALNLISRRILTE